MWTKKELKDKDNLTIKTYDSFQRHGIIIIDKDKENALVKVEKYDFDNPSNRQNKIAYKVDNPDFYESSLNPYNELLEKSTDYNCWFFLAFCINVIHLFLPSTFMPATSEVLK